MKLEEKAASIVRTTAILCLGTIVVLTLAFKGSLEAALYLGFSNEESRNIALGMTTVTAVFGALFGMLVTPPKEDQESASGAERSWEQPGPWVHKQHVPVEVGKWYSVSRKDELTGVYHSALPEGDFTGVAYTHSAALHYVEGAPLPKGTIAWLCVDETKFVAVTDEKPFESSEHFLIERSDGTRVCCKRRYISWQSEDGRRNIYLDDEKRVVRWLQLPKLSGELECTQQYKR